MAAEPAAPHPREDLRPLEGVKAQADAFEAALARGRLHHAWLLAGPEGLGKARFALRAARRLLGAAPDAAEGPLGVVRDDRAVRLLAARAHPDFLMLEREGADGKARRTIPVDEARRLPEFFSKAPAVAPYRVAVIDSADDLNLNAANAVLKTLEEPPPRGVLLLVSHAPGRLLDTIRSRCRTLRFAPWADADVSAWLQREHGLSAEAASRAAERARGSPGRAAALAASGAPDLQAEAEALVADLARPDDGRLLKLAEGFRGGEGADRFAALMGAVADVLRTRAQSAAAEGAAGAAAWSEAWRRAARAPAETEAVNLDRADSFWSVVGALRAAARVAAAA
ncbi:MAG: DNA polymerase III subunit delta' [Caulobacteraceae bacterium]|nr:DNA polymerase III subunit delta' [Caulobacter sp.]